MLLADTPPVTPSATIVTLDGVTTVLTAFVFVCLIMPTLVKNRSQFYAALACVAGIILAHTLVMIFNVVSFGGMAIGVLQLLAFLLLVLSVGGLTARELGGEMIKTIEVIRRGETEKEVIIPIGDKGPRKTRGEEQPRKVFKINSPPPVVLDDDDDEDKGIPLS